MGNYQMFDSEANEQMNFGAFVFWYLLRQCKETGVSSVSAWKEVPGMELSEKEQVAEQHEQYGLIYVKRKKQKNPRIPSRAVSSCICNVHESSTCL